MKVKALLEKSLPELATHLEAVTLVIEAVKAGTPESVDDVADQLDICAVTVTGERPHMADVPTEVFNLDKLVEWRSALCKTIGRRIKED